MPKKIPIEEFEAVVTVVAAHPGGVKIDAIRKGLGISLPDRMLQRRLRRLADEGRIVTKGTGKGKRYFPKRSPKPAAGEKNRSTPATGGIRLSANGEAIKQSVLRSVSERTPVVFVPHAEKDYQHLVAVLDSLIDTVGEDENHPLASLMEVIGVLIEKYEDEHVPELTKI